MLWVARKEIAGEVHGIAAMLRAKVADPEKINTLACIFGVSREQFKERVGVDGQFRVCAAHTFDWLSSGACAIDRHSRHCDERQQGGVSEEVSSVRDAVHEIIDSAGALICWQKPLDMLKLSPQRSYPRQLTLTTLNSGEPTVSERGRQCLPGRYD